MLLDSILLVISDLKKRKFSSFLTLLAISLGILTIFVIFLISTGFENSIQKQFEQFGTNRLFVTSVTTSLGSTSFTKGLSDNEVSLIENRPYIDKVYPYYGKKTQIKYGNEFKKTQILSTYLDSNYFEDTNLEIEKGRAPKLNEKFSIVIGPKAAKDLFSKEIPLGANLYINNTKFKVVGILKSVGNPQDDSSIYFNINTIRSLFGVNDQVGFIDVVLVEGYNTTLATNNLQILLDNKLGKDTTKIVAPTQLLEQMGSILNIVKYTLGGIAFIALIVGALGILNTMYVIVTEKTKEIGIIKAVGASNEIILFMYVFQAGFFGFLGAILGVILGSFTALGFEVFTKTSGYTFLTITIEPTIAVSLIFFGIIIGMISGFLPAYKASKTNIIEAFGR